VQYHTVIYHMCEVVRTLNGEGERENITFLFLPPVDTLQLGFS